MEICEKIMTPYAPRSLKVIGTDRDRSAAHEFLLVVIHSNHGLSRTVSRINAKIANFSHPHPVRVFITPALR